MRDCFYEECLDAITSILYDDAYVNIVISEYIGNNRLENDNLFVKIVYGTVENKLLLDYYLSKYLEKKVKDIKAINILRMGTYIICYLNLDAHFVVNELVALAKKFDNEMVEEDFDNPNIIRKAGLVNAILRKVALDKNANTLLDYEELDKTDHLKYLSVKYSTPISLVKFLLKQYDEKTLIQILTLHQEGNTYRINRYTQQVLPNKIDIKSYLETNNITYRLDGDTLYTKESLIDTILFKEGYIIAQDASSQQVSIIAQVKKGMRILDACSAPGAKATHLANIMMNEGEIIALDIFPHKIRKIEENCRKQNLSIIKPILMDATTCSFKEPFDMILLDAPCSGLGVISHKVDLKYRFKEEALSDLVVLQKSILENVIKYLKIGGILVYSTCTINTHENEGVMKGFLKRHNEFKVLEEVKKLPSNEGDGFYIIRLIKES